MYNQDYKEILLERKEMFEDGDEKAEKAFDAYFNEVYGDIVVAGMSYKPAYVLKSIDFTAYRQEFVNYCDSVLRGIERELLICS